MNADTTSHGFVMPAFVFLVAVAMDLRMKRRDLLLSVTSLVAASALATTGLASPAQAQQPAPAQPSGRRPNILVIFGDDVGVEYQRLLQPPPCMASAARSRYETRNHGQLGS